MITVLQLGHKYLANLNSTSESENELLMKHAIKKHITIPITKPNSL
jgi:hypothetical protein